MNDTQQPLNALPQGHRLQEYELVRVLGFGGFGMTYLGFDHNLDKAVAIKEYLPSDIATRTNDNSVVPQSSQFQDDFEWGLERFLDEARALARFDHRHIIKVHRFFEEHGTAYIVMEYAEGETLTAFLERKGTLKEAELKPILYPILDGLEVVHGADFLHRDIKPGNIIIRDEDNSPVLLDFGSARQAISARSRSVTSIITPGYAPIEQYSSRGDQGSWTDIYALGGVCYRALTGEVPEDATDRMRDDPLIPVSERCAGQVRAEFLSAVDWALVVDEGGRPQSITEWRAKLEDDSTKHEPVPVSQQGRHQDEKTIYDLPNHPLLKDVQKILWSAGLADAARQLGVSARELDFIRKKYGLRLPKLVARKKTKGKLRTAVICVVALSIIGILGKIYINQDQKTDWQVFVTMVGREPSLIGTNDRGETDLHIAAAWNLPMLIISLLNQGADINAQDNDGKTPLHTAVSTIFGGREREAIEMLLNQGADANMRDNDGDAPLHTVCWHNFHEMAEVLLKYGANVNVKDNDSNTPLHRAVWSNALETAEVLLKHGAHPNAKNNDGNTPLHAVGFYNAHQIAGVLLKHGANVNAKVNVKNKLYGWTPLHFAAIHNARETAEVLLNQGADVNAKDGSGNTPLSMTKPFNAHETAAVLRRYGGWE